jgi:SAM-dependent methyltransferase
VSIPFATADVRALHTVAGTFDVVLACDNALPHLLGEDLLKGVRGMAARLRPGGLFLASTRDYDALVQERPTFTPTRIIISSPCRRVVFQLWDWREDRTYRVNQFILKDVEGGWQLSHYATEYRALLRDEFTEVLHQAGLEDVRWHTPQACGYYQPVVTARKA